MNTSESINKHLDSIMKMDQEEVKIPKMPISVFLQEAKLLLDNCKTDFDILKGTGLREETLFDLKEAIRICEQAEMDFNSKQNFLKQMREEHKIKIAKLKSNYMELRRALKLYYSLQEEKKKLPEFPRRLDAYIQYTCNLCLKYEELVPESERPASLQSTDDYYNYAIETSKSIAQLKSDRHQISMATVYRNQCYTYLKKMVDKLYMLGKFTFQNSPAKQSLYQSSYTRHKSSRN